MVASSGMGHKEVGRRNLGLCEKGEEGESYISRLYTCVRVHKNLYMWAGEGEERDGGYLLFLPAHLHALHTLKEEAFSEFLFAQTRIWRPSFCLLIVHMYVLMYLPSISHGDMSAYSFKSADFAGKKVHFCHSLVYQG